MSEAFILSPRYSLDDRSPWLIGIDPARNYWIKINGDVAWEIAIPGLYTSSFAQFKQIILQFRHLKPQEQMTIERISGALIIHCITSNCYALETYIKQAPVWHLFETETLESLLLTSHPDWQCSSQDLDLGRKLLNANFANSLAA